MIKPKFIKDGNDLRVVIGPCRIAYPHVFEPHAAKDSNEAPKYSATILVPKSETETVNALNKAVKMIFNEAVPGKWGGKTPKDGFWNNPINDGDSPKKTGEERGDEFKDCYFITPKNIRKPLVLDKEGEPIEDADEIYGGVWALASICVYAYDKGSKGIGCQLVALKKWKDDTAWGGSDNRYAGDFDGTSDEEEDDVY